MTFVFPQIALVKSPCKGCERRTKPPFPDCHNADYCPAWGEYQEKLKQAKANQRKDLIPNGMLGDNAARRKDRYIKSDDR